jgi:hypothetical protein
MIKNTLFLLSFFFLPWLLNAQIITVIAGGRSNRILSGGYFAYNFVGGGASNVVNSSSNAAIAGGCSNRITSGYNGFVGGGYLNKIVGGSCNAIVGGQANSVNGVHNFIGGGYGNTLTRACSAILGGCNNSDGGVAFAGIFGCNVTAVVPNAFHANSFVAQNIKCALTLPTFALLLPGELYITTVSPSWCGQPVFIR